MQASRSTRLAAEALELAITRRRATRATRRYAPPTTARATAANSHEMRTMLTERESTVKPATMDWASGRRAELATLPRRPMAETTSEEPTRAK